MRQKCLMFANWVILFIFSRAYFLSLSLFISPYIFSTGKNDKNLKHCFTCIFEHVPSEEKKLKINGHAHRAAQLKVIPNSKVNTWCVADIVDVVVSCCLLFVSLIKQSNKNGYLVPLHSAHFRFYIFIWPILNVGSFTNIRIICKCLPNRYHT